MSAPFQLYRFTHGDGSSKSWGVRFNGDGTFTSIWGKTVTKMSFKTKGFKQPDEVQKLIRSKQRKGYEYLGGTFYMGDDGKISTVPPPSVPVNPEPSVEEPRIY